jgi:hypothetical protein
LPRELHHKHHQVSLYNEGVLFEQECLPQNPNVIQVFKTLNPVFINPEDEDALMGLRKGCPAFPKIEYENENIPLEDTTRLRKSISGIQSILRGKGLGNLVEKMEIKGSAADQCEWTQSRIPTLIHEFNGSANCETLREIFHCIHLWGGVSGRNIYVMNGGFESNFSVDRYLKMTRICKELNRYSKEDSVRTAKRLSNKNLKIPYLGIAFASKHYKFWTMDNLPILDSILNKGVLGRFNAPQFNKYPEFVDLMIDASQAASVRLACFERRLFNFFQSKQGERWIKLRK